MRNKSNYYRWKTKKWFQDKGYHVEYVEVYRRIVKENKTILLKKDLFGADMIAMNANEIIFANSVFGRKNIAKHVKEFEKYPFPDFVERWIVVWDKGKREPEIVEVGGKYEQEV
ncbi:MAG: hypothetical protein QXO44_03295 [Thermoplasmatales archaeon]